MLQEITLSPATIVIVLFIVAWAVWAVCRLVGRGMCDCGDHCDGCSKKDRAKGSPAVCRTCTVADDMVARMESSLQE